MTAADVSSPPSSLLVLYLPAGAESGSLRRIPAGDLRAMQALVGGPVEPLNLASDAVLYLNEEGRFAGLGINALANRLVGSINPGLHPEDSIVGDAYVAGRSRSGGPEHDTDVPASILTECERAGVRVGGAVDGTPDH